MSSPHKEVVLTGHTTPAVAAPAPFSSDSHRRHYLWACSGDALTS